MKKLLSLIVLASSLSVAMAQTAAPAAATAKPMTPAAAPAKPMAAATGTTQQNKMKTCNADATSKGVKGADRKAFMSTCLKG